MAKKSKYFWIGSGVVLHKDKDIEHDQMLPADVPKAFIKKHLALGDIEEREYVKAEKKDDSNPEPENQESDDKEGKK